MSNYVENLAVRRGDYMRELIKIRDDHRHDWEIEDEELVRKVFKLVYDYEKEGLNE